ncbi:E3 ubiquitin-protein ligase RHA2A-like [Primulina eburnea]|uniref:E3 ubiquitin-protein ligase RHA2A-like n=1 Tax=Primulina eburnea TaxID=1245227 RepID=UPI003C6C76AE
MGLQNQLSDLSSESVLTLTVVHIANSVRYLHALLSTILHTFGFFSSRFEHDRHHFGDSMYGVVGSGLASLVLLCDQLNLNQVCSYTKRSEDDADRFGSDCVVCLNRLGEGEKVRRLACCHVFHKDCFDGWLDHLNFNCPLCRQPLVSDEGVTCTQRRVADDLLAFLPIQ